MVTSDFVKQKRICLVLTSLRSGGLERNAANLANYFAGAGYLVSICCLYSTETFFSIDKNVEIYDFSTNKPKLQSLSIWKNKIHQFVKQNEIDAIISFGERCGIVVASAIKTLHVKHICRGINTKKSFINKMLLKAKSKNIDFFVCQTAAQKDNFSKKLQNKCVIIHNPFSNEKNNQNVDGVVSKRFVSVASFKLKQKKQDEMIKAFALFIKNHPDYKLELYGRYENKEYDFVKELIDRLNLSNSVKIMGESHNIKESIIPCRGFICSSTYEGMPNALVEALSYGIPVISTKWKGYKEVLDNEKNCLLYNSGNVKELSEKMVLLAEDNQLFSELSNRGCDYLITSEDPSNIYNRWKLLVD